MNDTQSTHPATQEPPAPAPAAGEVDRIEALIDRYGTEIQNYDRWVCDNRKPHMMAWPPVPDPVVRARESARAALETALADLAAQAERGRRVEAALDVGRITVVLERAAVRHPNNLYLSFDEAHDIAAMVVEELRAALAPDGGEEDRP